MGNCAASRLSGGASGDPDSAAAVNLCRERKCLLKSALEHRASLAAAHADYVHSLGAVAAAINLFVSRHSSPPPILLTFTASPAPPSPPPSPPLPAPGPALLRCTPSEPRTELSSSPTKKAFYEVGRGYFYSDPTPSAAGENSGGGFGWDFFNPFDGMQAPTEMVTSELTSEEELRAVREEEGIPDLEEEDVNEKDAQQATSEEAVVTEKVVNEGEEEGGRELLEALRDVQDQFERAYNAGKEVSRMLEAHRVCLPPAIDETRETKENSSKIVQAITWHRTTSSVSSSCKSYLASSSDSFSQDGSKGGLFDEYTGMESGSHSQTLGRLYAWEKKLYEEVKAGDETRQLYERKCVQLRNQDAKGGDSRSTDKTKAAVRDLYTRIFIALKSAETISARIEKLRDEELEPQLMELLQALARTWKSMLETHGAQKQIMSEVKHFACSSYGKFCTGSQRHATMRLEAELRYWRTCFMNYVSAQKAYVGALDGWLSKFVLPEVEYFSGSKMSHQSYGAGTPRLVVLSHEWLTLLRKLPESAVSFAMKRFVKDVRILWAKQGQEQQQKRKVDNLAKVLDRKNLALQKAEHKILESKISGVKPEPDVRQRVEFLAGRKELLEVFRNKLDSEKVKHHDCMQETERVTFNVFKTGLTNIFESLSEFSKDSANIYNELLKRSEKLNLVDGMQGKSFCIEGMQATENII